MYRHSNSCYFSHSINALITQTQSTIIQQTKTLKIPLPVNRARFFYNLWCIIILQNGKHDYTAVTYLFIGRKLYKALIDHNSNDHHHDHNYVYTGKIYGSKSR